MRLAFCTLSTTLLAALLSSCPAFAEPQTDPDDLELIRTLLAHNRAAREQIKSCRFEHEWESEEPTDGFSQTGMPAGTCLITAHGTHIQSGAWFRFDCQFTRAVIGTDFVERDRTQSILTDHCFVLVPSQRIKSIRYVVIDSISRMPPNERRLADATVHPHPLQFGFDDGPYAISPRLGLHPEIIKWSVSVSADGHTYEIVQQNPKRNTVTYTIAADKGYLITRRHVVDQLGKTLMDRQIQPAQYDGIWIARRVEDRDSLNMRRFRLTTHRAELNCDIPESSFDFETMSFDKHNTLLQRIVPGYDSVDHIYHNGQWVPKTLLN